jgi:hypothetical protein
MKKVFNVIPQQTVFLTVKKAQQALDSYMKCEGRGNRGGHRNRPDGTRGPVVLYDYKVFEVMFAIDRTPNRDGWIVRAVWLVPGLGLISSADILGLFHLVCQYQLKAAS